MTCTERRAVDVLTDNPAKWDQVDPINAVAVDLRLSTGEAIAIVYSLEGKKVKRREQVHTHGCFKTRRIWWERL